MALQLRGKTQIREASISLSKMVHVESQTIMGRHQGDQDGIDGVMRPLSAQETRQVLELDVDNNVQFASVTAGTITASQNLVSSGSLEVQGITTLHGSLNANGTGNSLQDLTISDTLDVTGLSSLDGGANVTGQTETDSLLVTGTSQFNQDVVMGADLSVSGQSTFGSLVVSGKLQHNGTDESTSFSSSFVQISGGSIDNTAIGQTTPAAGKFTSLDVDGDLTVGGDLTVQGTLTSLETNNTVIKDPLIHLGKDNNSNDDDLGFVAGYDLDTNGDGYYAGLIRDSSDGVFRLFSTDENLSETNQVTIDIDNSNYNYSKGTLIADVEGDITFETPVTISLSGDVSGSDILYGSQNGDISIPVTIGQGAVEFSHVNFVIDEGDMSSDSSNHVPTQQSVKTYVDNQIASGGYDSADLESKDMLMAYEDQNGDVSFVKVKEVYDFIQVDIQDEGNNFVDITITEEVDEQFDELSSVYLNGQKLRYESDPNADLSLSSTNDYRFSSDTSGEMKRLHISAGTLSENDELEIRYIVLS